ncbi:hypothetical protein Tco_0834120 [Tanacetum coccineum]
MQSQTHPNLNDFTSGSTNRLANFGVPVICLLDAVQEYGSNDALTLPDSSQLTELQILILFNALGMYQVHPPSVTAYFSCIPYTNFKFPDSRQLTELQTPILFKLLACVRFIPKREIRRRGERGGHVESNNEQKKEQSGDLHTETISLFGNVVEAEARLMADILNLIIGIVEWMKCVQKAWPQCGNCVVYVMTTPIPDDGGDDPTVEQVRKRAKTLEAKHMVEDASSKKFLVSNFTNYKMTDPRPVLEQYNELVAFDLLRDALSAIFGLSELKIRVGVDEFGVAFVTVEMDLMYALENNGVEADEKRD